MPSWSTIRPLTSYYWCRYVDQNCGLRNRVLVYYKVFTKMNCLSSVQWWDIYSVKVIELNIDYSNCCKLTITVTEKISNLNHTGMEACWTYSFMLICDSLKYGLELLLTCSRLDALARRQIVSWRPQPYLPSSIDSSSVVSARLGWGLVIEISTLANCII